MLLSKLPFLRALPLTPWCLGKICSLAPPAICWQTLALITLRTRHFFSSGSALVSPICLRAHIRFASEKSKENQMMAVATCDLVWLIAHSWSIDVVLAATPLFSQQALHTTALCSKQLVEPISMLILFKVYVLIIQLLSVRLNSSTVTRAAPSRRL